MSDHSKFLIAVNSSSLAGLPFCFIKYIINNRMTTPVLQSPLKSCPLPPPMFGSYSYLQIHICKFQCGQAKEVTTLLILIDSKNLSAVIH